MHVHVEDMVGGTAGARVAGPTSDSFSKSWRKADIANLNDFPYDSGANRQGLRLSLSQLAIPRSWLRDLVPCRTGSSLGCVMEKGKAVRHPRLAVMRALTSPGRRRFALIEVPTTLGGVGGGGKGKSNHTNHRTGGAKRAVLQSLYVANSIPQISGFRPRAGGGYSTKGNFIMSCLGRSRLLTRQRVAQGNGNPNNGRVHANSRGSD